MEDKIYGYCDRPNVKPGETLDFYIDTNSPERFDARVIRLTRRIIDHVDGDDHLLVDDLSFPDNLGFSQKTQVGSFIEIPEIDGLNTEGGLSLHIYCWPTTPQKTQTLIGCWNNKCGWRLGIEKSRFFWEIGDGEQSFRVTSPTILESEVWFSVVATFDPKNGELNLTHNSVINSVNSRFSPIVGYDGMGGCSGVTRISIGAPKIPLIIAGAWKDDSEERYEIIEKFNGKLEAPRLFSSAQVHELIHTGEGINLLAHWDFANEIGRQGITEDSITDVSGNNYHGRTINQPDRAMTGRLWEGIEERFIYCPEQYAAIWFHEDSLDDCRWNKSITLKIPHDLASGAYALALNKGQIRDYIPFFVTPNLREPKSKVALLIPTFSYMAYANTQVMQNANVAQAVMGVLTTLDHRDLDLNTGPEFGLSTYDYHIDGRGVQYSTWKRPILNMRPDYRHEFGSVWQFPADLDLIEWLTYKEIEFDIITDHDLVKSPADLLNKYSIVISPSHAEYYSSGMLDSWENYLASGGCGMYLGGNGFYWVTSSHPKKPWIIEVRKGESGDQAWRARPGELHHSTTGERGGLWRHRARAPQKLWGIGYTGHGLDSSAPYHQMPDAKEQRNASLMAGISPNDLIGATGSVNGGASGLEMDRIDYALGTPPHTELIASSFGHSANAMLAPEEMYFSHSGMTGQEHPNVRADIVYFNTKSGGAVFSTGSMAWCGSLMDNDAKNNVSTLTENAIKTMLRLKE